MASARKAIILGLDAVTPVVLRRLIAEGVLPNLQTLIERGVFAEALAPVPGLTHCNWVSIATGAWPSTHGVSCHTVHIPGEPLDVVHNAYTSDFSRAEFLWNAAERAGKRSILMKYLCSWPPTLRQGWQVSGHGNPDSSHAFTLGQGRAHSTRDERGGLRFATAEGWQHLPSGLMGATEAVLELATWHGERIRWWLLLGRPSDGAPPVVTIAPTKDYTARLCSLAEGEWSEWLPVQTSVAGQRREARVRFKVMELAGDGSAVALFQTDLLPTDGFTHPAALARELLEVAGPFYESPHLQGADPQTRLELISYQADWIAKASRHLMARSAWDLYFLQWWWTDMSGHAYLHRVDPSVPGYDAATGKKYWTYFKEEYAQCDRLVGELIAGADDETAIVVVSDHGMLNGTTVFMNNALRQAGLLTLTADAEGNPVVDWTRTKAFAQRSVYVYVNLKGRDPQGIVAPGEEYEQVRCRVIDALYAIREPGTGRRPVALAVRSEDGGIVGVHRSDHVGDIVYLMDEGFGTLFPCSEDQVYARGYRGFGNAGDWRRTEALFGDRIWSHHGSQLPGLTYGLSSEKAILIMAGPGIKRGTVLPGPVWIIDAAPTVASLLGIPRPAQASGRVLEEALAPQTGVIAATCPSADVAH